MFWYSHLFQNFLQFIVIHTVKGFAAERSYPMSKEQQLCGSRRAKRSYSTFKVRRGGREEVPLIQGKRNPSKTVGVARGRQRADTLKPYSQKTSQSDYMDHSLV